MNQYYLHKVELATRQSVIVIDNHHVPGKTHAYLNGFPITSGGSASENKTQWTLGPLETEREADRLALTLAKCYGCDVMKSGEMLGLPYIGKPGEWVSMSEAASILGAIKSAKKAAASRENGKNGGRPPKWAKKEA